MVKLKVSVQFCFSLLVIIEILSLSLSLSLSRTPTQITHSITHRENWELWEMLLQIASSQQGILVKLSLSHETLSLSWHWYLPRFLKFFTSSRQGSPLEIIIQSSSKLSFTNYASCKLLVEAKVVSKYQNWFGGDFDFLCVVMELQANLRFGGDRNKLIFSFEDSFLVYSQKLERMSKPWWSSWHCRNFNV